jgi:hypothetical protein
MKMFFGQTFKTQKKNLRKKKNQTLISTLFKKNSISMESVKVFSI